MYDVVLFITVLNNLYDDVDYPWTELDHAFMHPSLQGFPFSYLVLEASTSIHALTAWSYHRHLRDSFPR